MSRPFSARLRARGPASPVAGRSRLRWRSRCSPAPWPGRSGRPARPTAPRTRGSPSGPAPAATSRSTWTPGSSCPTARRPTDTVPAVLLAHGFGGTKESTLRRRRGPGRPRLRGADLDRPRLRAQRRADPPRQPRLRGTRRPAAARLARRPAGHPHRRRRRPAGRRGRRLVRRRPGPAARRAGPAGRRDRPDDHLERPGRRVPAGVAPAAARSTACSRSLGGPVLRQRSGGGDRPGRARRRRRRGGRRERRHRGRGADPSCGRFAADVCAAYLRIATTGRADPAAVDLLRRSSPAGVLDRIKAPTLLVQGTADTLFPLSEADANARGHRRRPARRYGSPGSPAATTAATGPQSDRDRVKLPDGAVARPLRQGRRATRRRPASPGRGSPASTRSTGAWSTSGFSAGRLPGARRHRDARR